MSAPSFSPIYYTTVTPRTTRAYRHWLRWLLFAGIALAGVIGVSSHSSAAMSAVRSAAGNYCIDLNNDTTTPGTAVDSRTCNASHAQAWTVTHDALTHNTTSCLAVADDSTRQGSPVVVEPCSDAPGQVWLQTQKGLENPHSDLCLSIPSDNTTGQLVIEPCAVTTNTRQQWSGVGLGQTQLANDCRRTSGGERVACYAELEWDRWQTDSSNHEDLLNQYTANSPDESWCADFVSYVYKEAGQPFTGGDVVNWDVAAAYEVKLQGFTMHDPDSYTPKAGDVAVFNYSGGHTEIVIKGGPHPTFLYGNSGTLDPTTGNGQMATNTITSDEPDGELIYYLSKT